MDKVIINSATLTSIADAIRERGNTSDELYPSAMADAIRAALPAGIEFGEYTPVSDVTTFKVEHHLGVIPYAVFVWKDSLELVPSSMRCGFSVNGELEYSEKAGRYISSYGLARTIRDAQTYYSNTVATQVEGDDGYGDTETHFFAPESSGTVYLAGVTYKWMAVAL